MKSHSYPPGPRGIPVVGSAFSFIRNPIGFLQNIASEYGDIVSFRIGLRNFFLLNHPDYVQEVLATNPQNFTKGPFLERGKLLLGEGLLTSDGDYHRRQRQLSQPAFHRKRIEGFADEMTSCAARTRESWENGATMDMVKEMMNLTLAIVGRTTFGTSSESEVNDCCEALTIAMEGWRPLLFPFSQILEKLPLASVRRFYEARDRLDGIIFRLINEHRVSGEDRSDFLSMLLLARDEQGDGSGMTDVQVRDEVVTLLLAGHETMTGVLSWTWYLLSEHPEVEAKLHSEIDTVLAGRLPSLDDVANLQYTRMVFTEAMRLYPPIWAFGRRAVIDYKIDPYVIPAGALIYLSPYAMQHHPRYYPDPFHFDPERWTPEARAGRPRFAYFPFGGGPRQCIGEQYAWLEGVLVIATLAQKWQMRLVPGHPVELQPLISLRPKHGMKLRLEERLCCVLIAPVNVIAAITYLVNLI